ncbi:hypothetical protein RGUI_0991 [Rhodovulum sp. P5]|uniref:VPLPA-CTERM sorting domain-containing protein n=1 Tax=Rhodovulum sp. P5 TaxID=1564506 RepID=UPI0009C23ED8|nr:VPLPA-CTERM sorting domain-containing protein [Rhodovulum sp. P5]ARE39132.1 hypothetical protein RGUI_0991 [Rhodovulum sp. P5]
MKQFKYGLAAAMVLMSPLAANAGVLNVFSANEDTAAALTPTVDAFRAALGTLNSNDPVNGDANGRRQINWDAAPDAVSDPNAFPGDFFNANVAPRARGIEFRAAGNTTGFQLSSTAASGEPVEFGFPAGFTFFSAERLFTPVGDTVFDVVFFDPADQVTQAVTRGLGVVFTDVESNTGATMSFYDIDDTLLYEQNVLSGSNASLSFLGVTFTDAEVARVRINAGIEGFDSIVMDDFIFGEPVAATNAVPLPASLAFLPAGLAALGLMRRRRPGAIDPVV